MKKQRSVLIGLFLAVIFVLFVSVNTIYAEEESIYGHISFVDNEATIIHQDQSETKAVVNMPVTAGDQIVTGEKDRCELQFDNGTIIRIDHNTRLKVTTVLAPTLTSHWKITTLNLLKGQVYTMTQQYNIEMFQVITPNAAFNMKNRSCGTIQVRDNGDTFVFGLNGKFELMYGDNADKVKTETIKSGKNYIVTSDNKLIAANEKKDLDFIGWNEYVTRHFYELHKGINKVPPILNSYKNSALRYWVEKWSSLYGEWVYDEIFGYVWKPADEIFAYAARPFWNADFAKINGELFLVPQQPWGWAPAHMGTWIWTNSGWTWMPSSFLNSGGYGSFDAQFGFHSWGLGYYASLFNRWHGPMTFDYYMCSAYGGYDLYYLYRSGGIDSWRNAYYDRFHVVKKDPGIKNLPGSIREIMKKIDNSPVKIVKQHLGDKEPISTFLNVDKVRTVFANDKKLITVDKNNPVTLKENVRNVLVKKDHISKDTSIDKSDFRDFNPDRQWGIRYGIDIKYSSEKNAVIIPKTDINSREISNRDRYMLRERVTLNHNFNGISGASVSGSVTVSSIPTTTINSSNPGDSGRGHATPTKLQEKQ